MAPEGWDGLSRPGSPGDKGRSCKSREEKIGTRIEQTARETRKAQLLQRQIDREK